MDSIQLIVIDADMDAKSPKLLKELRKSHPGVLVLFIGRQDEVSHTMDTASRAFLKQPFRRSRFLGRVLEATDPLVKRSA
jgi:hypothetical protein